MKHVELLPPRNPDRKNWPGGGGRAAEEAEIKRKKETNGGTNWVSSNVVPPIRERRAGERNAQPTSRIFALLFIAAFSSSFLFDIRSPLSSCWTMLKSERPTGRLRCRSQSTTWTPIRRWTWTRRCRWTGCPRRRR